MVEHDAGTALRRVAEGCDVVLVAAADSPPLRVAGPGRLAVMVGDPADRDVLAAASEMERELFGPSATSRPGPAPA